MHASLKAPRSNQGAQGSKCRKANREELCMPDHGSYRNGPSCSWYVHAPVVGNL